MPQERVKMKRREKVACMGTSTVRVDARAASRVCVAVFPIVEER